jgi:hypothetical protein
VKAAAQHSSSELGSAFTLHRSCTVKLKEQARSTGDETNEKHSLTKVKATKVERKIKFINKQKLN